MIMPKNQNILDCKYYTEMSKLFPKWCNFLVSFINMLAIEDWCYKVLPETEKIMILNTYIICIHFIFYLDMCYELLSSCLYMIVKVSGFSYFLSLVKFIQNQLYVVLCLFSFYNLSYIANVGNRQQHPYNIYKYMYFVLYYYQPTKKRNQHSLWRYKTYLVRFGTQESPEVMYYSKPKLAKVLILL